MKNLLIIGLIGIGGYLLLAKKQFATKTNWTFDKMDFDIKKRRIKITLGVANPTNESATVNSITGNLIINGSTIATVESFDKQLISPTSKSRINLTLIPSAMGIFSQAKAIAENLVKGKNKEKKQKIAMSAIFNGAANVNGLVLPIDLKLV